MAPVSADYVNREDRIGREDVSRWFDIGTEAKFTHLIIIMFDNDLSERPAFVSKYNDVKFIKQKYEEANNCRIYEVYNLKMDKEEQLNQRRCWNF